MNAQWEYDLRIGSGTSRILMERVTYPGDDEYRPWRDIATFGSYNDAEHVLRLLRKAAPLDGCKGDAK